MKCSFSDDPGLGPTLFDLLDTVFPGLREGARQARALGAAWESVSTPFVGFEGGRAVSHVGVIELSLVVCGQLTKVGSIHAVATHPDCRHRGLYRQVMGEALRHCASRYETVILTTEHPEYFAPFGFRHVREHAFTAALPPAGGTDAVRELDLQDPDDLTLLHRLLETRTPVSEVVGVVDEKAVFFFNEGRRPLHHVAGLDVVVCLELDGTRLTFFDVVGPRIPNLAELVSRLPWEIEEVEIDFCPDRLGVDARPVPRLLDHDGPSYLMVRGPFAAEGRAFTLPRSART
ncbi:MAG: GNAT family N-acetyltransferase [Thermoanaerobaculaceae bacterium]|jgi:predicted N-acetyltransferase YhbS|nr:GNAT family N-acetyltransferase [Thermoanaerobaculaceae bacterium]